MESDTIIICPHCQKYVVIEKLNCGIFRHGVLVLNGVQMPPHAPKSECDRLVRDNAIYGCGKPFRLQLKEPGSYEAVKCDYV